MARDKRKKRKRHSASNYMPSIQPNPNLDKDKIHHLPKIISDCNTDLSQKDIDEIKLRLNFADHNDLIRLHCIRIVNQASIKLPSKESTCGCYYPENGSKKEYNELNGLNDNTSGKKKKKWIHPLNKEKYRERFNLPDR